jgi:hypothetical protein
MDGVPEREAAAEGRSSIVLASGDLREFHGD